MHIWGLQLEVSEIAWVGELSPTDRPYRSIMAAGNDVSPCLLISVVIPHQCFPSPGWPTKCISKPSLRSPLALLAGAAGHHNHVAQSHHRRATSVSAFTSPHGPTMTGTVDTCNKWYKVVSGDTCYSITQKFGISLDDFHRWNPVVSDDCLTNFHAEVFYCVGVGSISSSGVGGSSTATPPVTTASTAKIISTIAATSSNTTTTTPYSTLTYNTTTYPVTTTNSAWPPSLTQPGQPDYCMCHRQD
jgi:hypothetical protein